MTAEAPGDAVRVGVAAEEDGLLREAGIVPWWWIEDETRTRTDWRCGESVAHCIMEGIDQARIDPWSDRPPLVLCESRATAGVLRSLAGEFVGPIAGTAGQVGGFLHTDIAPAVRSR